MANLFIIGKGFNLYHNLPTHYAHYDNNFLRTTYSYAFENSPFRIVEGSYDQDGSISYVNN